MCFVPEDSAAKSCNTINCKCQNDSNIYYCIAGGGGYCCSTGSVGGRGIMNMTAKEIESSHEIFWGEWTPNGLRLKGVGLFRKIGLEINDVLVSVNGLRLAKDREREQVCKFEFDGAVEVVALKGGKAHVLTLE